MARKPKPGSNEPIRVNGWQMVRDVLIASMNKGQFPLAIFSLVVMFWIYKLPSATVADLTSKAFTASGLYHIGGYVLTAILAFGWFFHSKHQRRSSTEEIRRLGSERTELQQKLMEFNRLPSSDKQ